MTGKLFKYPDGDWVVEVPEDSKGIKGSMMQGHFASTFGHGYKLSLKNCQVIERGYDLDELAKTIFPDRIFTTNEEYETPIDGFPYQWGFKVGFQKALELMGDKKYSEGDMLECWNSAVRPSNFWSKFMDSLQQTEWDVEVEMDEEKEFIFDPAMGISQGHYSDKPKLDADGCLILKLKDEKI